MPMYFSSLRYQRRLKGTNQKRIRRAQKYADPEKGRESIRKAQKRHYAQSEKGREKLREARKRYAQSEKSKEAFKRYAQSEKGKEAFKRYAQSEKGREAQRLAIQQYRIRSREARNRYMKKFFGIEPKEPKERKPRPIKLSKPEQFAQLVPSPQWDKLTTREALFVQRFYGVAGEPESTCQAIADEFGTTRQNVSRIVKAAIKKLQEKGKKVIQFSV